MSQDQAVLDRKDLQRLEERLRRGIPKWEQAHFIEMVVPQLVEKLQKYLKVDSRP